MWRRIFSFLVVVSFLAFFSTATAQLPRKPGLGETEQEKEQEATETAETESARSSDTFKEITWADNRITFQVPDNWEQRELERDSAWFELSGTEEGVWLSATINRVHFRNVELALDTYREVCEDGKEEERVASCEDYAIGDFQGVLELEAEKEDPEGGRALTWKGIVQRGGRNHSVLIMLWSKSKVFPKHEETFRKVLSTFEIETE